MGSPASCPTQCFEQGAALGWLFPAAWGAQPRTRCELLGMLGGLGGPHPPFLPCQSSGLHQCQRDAELSWGRHFNQPLASQPTGMP